MAESLRAENLTKIYEMGAVDIVALREVTLEVEPGRFVVVLGPSGSGKTTLINLLGGLTRPTSGSVFFGGTNVSELPERGLTSYRRRHVGFVFQNFNLIPTLTAAENVDLAAGLVDDHLTTGEVLEGVGLAERRNHFVSQLSGGEQQRVSIARALVKNPDVLLCDEPTGSLDLDTGRQVLSALKRTQRDYGKTVVLITHNNAIAAIADMLVRLSSGHLESVESNPNPADPESVTW